MLLLSQASCSVMSQSSRWFMHRYDALVVTSYNEAVIQQIVTAHWQNGVRVSRVLSFMFCACHHCKLCSLCTMPCQAA